MAETFTKLATVTLPSAYKTITFSSISQNYSSLVLIGSAKLTSTTSYYGVIAVYFNTTSATSSYNAANFENNTTTVVGQKEAGTNYFRIDCPQNAASNNANEFSSMYMTINKYSTTGYKPVHLHNAMPIQSTNLFQDIRAGLYNNSNAITSIILYVPDTGVNMAANTTFTLYGIGQSGSTNTGTATGTYS